MNKSLAMFFLGWIIIILVAVFISIYYNLKSKDIIPIIISITALILSVFSLFKSNILPADLKTIAGNNVIVVQDIQGGINTLKPGIILPITFINNGYGDCVVEVIALKIISPNNNLLLFEPIAEIDIKSLMQGKHTVHGSNVVNSYSSFNLFGRSSKITAFYFLEKKEKQILHLLELGEYNCTFYIKKDSDKKLLPYSSFKFLIDKINLNSIKNGSSCVFMRYEYKF